MELEWYGEGMVVEVGVEEGVGVGMGVGEE